jgi:hypothetical protein
MCSRKNVLLDDILLSTFNEQQHRCLNFWKNDLFYFVRSNIRSDKKIQKEVVTWEIKLKQRSCWQ